MDDATAETKDYDRFFLQHLQAIKGNAAWYLNHKFIGRGGNGTTFFVTCTSGENQGTQFALKVFHRISDNRRRERFLEETQHYKNLSHPAIVKIYDEGTFKAGDRSYPFAVIDFMPENLEMRLGRGAVQVSRYQVLRYIMNIVSGVAYLHGQNKPIVHRDIKPANIFVNGPIARLGDLGLAKVLMEKNTQNAQEEEMESSEDAAAYIAMPTFYRTPELVDIANRKKVRLTPASDIYQIGLVLYRSLTGFNPQKPPGNNITAPISLDIRDIAGVAGDHLSALIEKMLQDVPSKRPDVQSVLNELDAIHKIVCEADRAATGVVN